MDHEISLKNPDEFFSNNILIELNNQLCQDKEVDIIDQKILDNYAARILDAKHNQVNINKIATNQQQFYVNQCHDQQYFLAKYNELFDGSLHVHPTICPHWSLT